MEVGQKKLDLEDKLIQYINKMIDKTMEETALSSSSLELIIQYLKS